MELELPNGIKDSKGNWTKYVEIDEMTGDEENVLVDQTREGAGKGAYKKSGSRRLTEILSRCTVAIGDDRRPDGHNRFDYPDHFVNHWLRALSADRVFTMIRLRQLSLGNIYRFAKSCPECGKEIANIKHDLSKLDVTSISLERMAAPKTLTLPKTKHQVTWKSITGSDEEVMDRLMAEHKADFMSAALYTRIESVRQYDAANGTYGETAPPPGGLLFTKRLPQSDCVSLRKEFDGNEGGIDTEIKIVCTEDSCRKEFTTKLEVMSADFFFPSDLGSE